MREIKFRGRDRELFVWRYGDLDTKSSPDLVSIIEDCDYSVDPKTVGQFTGLLDANGLEIYEGDVIRTDFMPHMRTDVCNGYVVYENGGFYVEYIDHTYANLGDLIFYSGTSTSVIGNIHDNPELLEVKEDAGNQVPRV